MTRLMIPAMALLLAAPAAALAAGAGATSHHAATVTEQQARNDIRTDGYTRVQNLKKSKEGWTAQAMEATIR